MPAASPTAAPASGGPGGLVSDALPMSVPLEIGAIILLGFGLLILATWYSARRDRAG